MALNEVKTIYADENLNNGMLFLWISLGINIALGMLGTVDTALSSLSLVGFILTYVAYMKLELWTNDISLKRNSQKLLEMKEGFSTIKLGTLLSVIIIGIFMLPGGFKQAGRSMMSEFGENQAEPGTSQASAPLYGQPPQPSGLSGHQATEVRFCSTCGMKITDPTVEFCDGCGNKL